SNAGLEDCDGATLTWASQSNPSSLVLSVASILISPTLSCVVLSAANVSVPAMCSERMTSDSGASISYVTVCSGRTCTFTPFPGMPPPSHVEASDHAPDPALRTSGVFCPAKRPEKEETAKTASSLISQRKRSENQGLRA